MKICRVGVEVFRADGRTDKQTDMTKLIIAFSQFRERANKWTNMASITVLPTRHVYRLEMLQQIPYSGKDKRNTP